MQWSEISVDPSRRHLRQFAGAGFVFLTAVAAWRFWTRGETSLPIVLGLAGLALGVVGLLRPGGLRPIYVAAMIAAFPIGWVVSWVMLGLVYFAVFTPVAVVFRLVGRDPLQRRERSAPGSYWTSKRAPDDVKSYLKPY